MSQPLPSLPLGTWAPSYASHQYFPQPPKMQSALRLQLLVEWGRGEGVRCCSWKLPHGWALGWLWHSQHRSNDNSNQPIYFISTQTVQFPSQSSNHQLCEHHSSHVLLWVPTLQYRSYQQLNAGNSTATLKLPTDSYPSLWPNYHNICSIPHVCPVSRWDQMRRPNNCL